MKKGLAKKLIFLTLAAVFITIIYYPVFYVEGLPGVTVYKPEYINYTKTISGKGRFVEQQNREVYLDMPVIASKIMVSPGDFVTRGQVLMTVDTQKSLELIKSVKLNISELYDYLDPDSIMSLIKTTGIDGIEGALNGFNVPTKIPSKEVFSPITGQVTEVNAAVGKISGVNEPVFIISPNQKLTAVINISESDMPKLRVGQAAFVTSPGVGGKLYFAKVSAISSDAKKVFSGMNTETIVEITLSLEQPDSDLKSGYTADAVIGIDETEKLMTIPVSAIMIDERNNEYVYLFDKGRAVKKYIETYIEFEDNIAVSKGLTVSDYVILNPNEVINENTFVVLTQKTDG